MLDDCAIGERHDSLSGMHAKDSILIDTRLQEILDNKRTLDVARLSQRCSSSHEESWVQVKQCSSKISIVVKEQGVQVTLSEDNLVIVMQLKFILMF